MTKKHKPLPVPGYTEQSPESVAKVKQFKEAEERLLRVLDDLAVGTMDSRDMRWLSIGRTHMETAFMCIYRSIFKPQRIKLPEDA